MGSYFSKSDIVSNKDTNVSLPPLQKTDIKIAEKVDIKALIKNNKLKVDIMDVCSIQPRILLRMKQKEKINKIRDMARL